MQPIIIVGAGIGGLSLAQWAWQAGLPVVLCEQEPDVPGLGVGVNVLSSGAAFLDRLGLLRDLRSIAVEPHEVIYAHRKGGVILRRPCGVAAGRTPQISVSRVALHRNLWDLFGADRIRVGHRLIDYDPTDDGVICHFEDPTGARLPSISGSMLVGADGARSMVRRLLHPDIKPKLRGIVYRGAADYPTSATGGVVRIVGGSAVAKLASYGMGPGSTPDRSETNWALLRPLRDGEATGLHDWSQPANRVDVVDLAKQVAVPEFDHHDLIARTSGIWAYPVADIDPLPWWSYGRVTLLGDAAHRMSPMGSPGVTEAMRDALSLVHHLVLFRHDPVMALRSYDADRRPAMAMLLASNRDDGPEKALTWAERKYPDGITHMCAEDQQYVNDIYDSYHFAWA